MEYDLDQVLQTNINESIDKDIQRQILSSPPFINVPGSFNARDMSDGSISELRSGFAFRSGSLERLEEGGSEALVDHGIKAIFDLRSSRETRQFPEPEIPGIQTMWQPSTWDNETTEKPSEPEKEEFSLQRMYLKMMQTHKASFKQVLAHIRDHPDQPFLIHCTAGRDRTGLMAALILGVAGASPAYIDREYALSRVGVEPVRSLLIKKLTGGGVTDMNNPIIQAQAGIQTKAISPLLELINDQYGGLFEYVKNDLGFTDADVDQMRKNLRSQEA